MKSIGVMILLSCFFAGHSQDNGKSLYDAGRQERLRLNSPNTDPYIPESTSAFFSDKWMISTLVFANGKKQSGLAVKLDLFENKIYYLDEAGKENVGTSDINEIMLADTSKHKAYRFINSSVIKASGVETGWYELLCAGDVALYKKTIKSLPRSMSKSSDEEIKPLETSVQFFVLAKGKLLRVKRGKDIPEVIEGERKEQLKEYVRSKNLTGKKDEDMIEIVTYYNNLK